jgi:hypothetical protein
MLRPSYDTFAVLLEGRPAACAGAFQPSLKGKVTLMKRLLVLVAVLVPLSWFAVGCDSGGGASSSPAAKKAAQESEEKTKAAMQKGGGGLKGMPAAPGK